MTKKVVSKLGHNKKSFLSSPVEHIDFTSFDARKIIKSMGKMSFTSRDTANAAQIYNEMLDDKDCSIFLTIAGSTSAGGCMDLYSDLVKYNIALDGLEKCLGVVIGFNGKKAVSVQWFDSHTVGREFSCELAEFLDIVSENR